MQHVLKPPSAKYTCCICTRDDIFRISCVDLYARVVRGSIHCLYGLFLVSVRVRRAVCSQLCVGCPAYETSLSITYHFHAPLSMPTLLSLFIHYVSIVFFFFLSCQPMIRCVQQTIMERSGPFHAETSFASGLVLRSQRFLTF